MIEGIFIFNMSTLIQGKFTYLHPGLGIFNESSPPGLVQKAVIWPQKAKHKYHL